MRARACVCVYECTLWAAPPLDTVRLGVYPLRHPSLSRPLGSERIFRNDCAPLANCTIDKCRPCAGFYADSLSNTIMIMKVDNSIAQFPAPLTFPLITCLNSVLKSVKVQTATGFISSVFVKSANSHELFFFFFFTFS